MPETEEQASADQPFQIRKVGWDYEVDLGTMPRAICIAWYEDGYGISIRSFFPFDEPSRKKRYKTANTAMRMAFAIVREWMDSILNSKGVSIEEEINLIEGTG